MWQLHKFRRINTRKTFILLDSTVQLKLPWIQSIFHCAPPPWGGGSWQSGQRGLCLTPRGAWQQAFSAEDWMSTQNRFRCWFQCENTSSRHHSFKRIRIHKQPVEISVREGKSFGSRTEGGDWQWWVGLLSIRSFHANSNHTFRNGFSKPAIPMSYQIS